jgi:hypothetical protein
MIVTMPQLAEIFALAAERAKHVEHEMLEKTCVLLEDSAKSAIGNDDYIFGWPRLAQSTIDRQRLRAAAFRKSPILP